MVCAWAEGGTNRAHIHPLVHSAVMYHLSSAYITFQYNTIFKTMLVGAGTEIKKLTTWSNAGFSNWSSCLCQLLGSCSVHQASLAVLGV